MHVLKCLLVTMKSVKEISAKLLTIVTKHAQINKKQCNINNYYCDNNNNNNNNKRHVNGWLNIHALLHGVCQKDYNNSLFFSNRFKMQLRFLLSSLLFLRVLETDVRLQMYFIFCSAVLVGCDSVTNQVYYNSPNKRHSVTQKIATENVRLWACAVQLPFTFAMYQVFDVTHTPSSVVTVVSLVTMETPCGVGH